MVRTLVLGTLLCLPSLALADQVLEADTGKLKLGLGANAGLGFNSFPQLGPGEVGVNAPVIGVELRLKPTPASWTIDIPVSLDVEFNGTVGSSVGVKVGGLFHYSIPMTGDLSFGLAGGIFFGIHNQSNYFGNYVYADFGPAARLGVDWNSNVLGGTEFGFYIRPELRVTSLNWYEDAGLVTLGGAILEVTAIFQWF